MKTTQKNIRRSNRRSPRTVTESAAIAAGLSPRIVEWIGNIAERLGTEEGLEQVRVSTAEKLAEQENAKAYGSFGGKSRRDFSLQRGGY